MDYVPGGSSGAAVSVGGLECVHFGSDTGGLVRNPASFCGVVGYKPTYGLISRYGLTHTQTASNRLGLNKNSEDTVLVKHNGIDENDNTTIDNQ